MERKRNPAKPDGGFDAGTPSCLRRKKMTKEEITKKIAEASKLVRETKPLAPSITNTVTVNFVANAQIACGGSAAMVYLPDEGECVAEIGGSVYINLGTLFPFYDETVARTARKLADLKKNWVLDPVGLGIGSLRTKIVIDLKNCPPTVIRGNASEIIALSKMWNLTSGSDSEGPKGVDTVDTVKSAEEAAKSVAKFIKGAVAVSGVEDFVTDGTTSVYSKGGSHFMEKITGAGCSLGGVCAVYASVTDSFTAALAATQHYNLAGSRAEKKASGPAGFQMNFIDELYLAKPEEIAENEFRVL